MVRWYLEGDERWCYGQTLVRGDAVQLAQFERRIGAEDTGQPQVLASLLPMPEGLRGASYEWALSQWGAVWADQDTTYRRRHGVAFGAGQEEAGFLTYLTPYRSPGVGWEQISERYPNLGFVTVWSTTAPEYGSYVCVGGLTLFRSHTPSELMSRPTRPGGGFDDSLSNLLDQRMRDIHWTMAEAALADPLRYEVAGLQSSFERFKKRLEDGNTRDLESFRKSLDDIHTRVERGDLNPNNPDIGWERGHWEDG